MITKQCCILIGGMGSRLGALTLEKPKPLLPVGNIPFIDVLIDEAVRRGFTDIVLLAGYKAHLVREYAESLQQRLGFGCRVRVSIEPEPLGTGGAVLYAAELLADSFLLLNGDTWFDFNWLDLFRVAGGRNAVAMRQLANADRHERVRVRADGAITCILPRSVGSGPALVNGGVYAFCKSAFEGFPHSFSIEHDLLPALIQRSELKGHQYDGFFLDIGIPQSFEIAQTEIPLHRHRPAVFFDRDGVLNHDYKYVASIDRFHWVDGAKKGIRLVNDLGYYVFVVTNQAGVARGYYAEDDVRLLHGWISDELRKEAAWIDDWRYCPYHPDGSVERFRSAHPWRKPDPGMILDLLERWSVDRSRSVLVGDKESDCAAARAAGIKALKFADSNLYEFLVDAIPALPLSK